MRVRQPQHLARTPPPLLLQPPRAPPDHLRLHAFQILSRLSLISAFRPWLTHTQLVAPHKYDTPPFELLFHCFAFGAPLGTLLTLLGSPAPSHLVQRADEFDWSVGMAREEREMYFESFVQRVGMLEVQGRVPYGEVLRCEDFLSGTCAGFAKVLRTVYRLLIALQESYPGLFVVPTESHERRLELLQELIDTEQAHLSILKAVAVSTNFQFIYVDLGFHENYQDAATSLSRDLQFMEPSLECFLINRTRLIQYHERVLQSLGNIASQSTPVQWTRIFALDDDITRTRVFGAYRSICINYLSLVEFLEETELEPTLAEHAQLMLDNISSLIARISDYTIILQDILDTTLPSPSSSDHSYNTLCEALFRLRDVSTTLHEVRSQLRTMRSVRILRARAYIWTAPDPDELGVILLDDCVYVDGDGVGWVAGRWKKGGTKMCAVFLFEEMLLCCREGPKNAGAGEDGDGRGEREGGGQEYPIRAWEVGPALKGTAPLDIVHAIPTACLQGVCCPDASSIEIRWVGKDEEVRCMTFHSMSFPQWDQWVSTLQPFVPPIYRPPTIPSVVLGSEPDNATLSEDEDDDGKRIVHARSWSLIARKPPRSESSSFIDTKAEDEDQYLFSPGLLPTLFNSTHDVLRSPSPLSLTNAVISEDRPPTPPVDDGFGSPDDPGALLDLTGQIVREGRYPSAHGGFSDVWKGVWRRGMAEEERTVQVAVKVLRSRIDDPEMEEKMIRRLRRELSIWKNLDHPHILGLYGTASDFGHYSSMVCPWMEHGSVTKHMERSGDIMSTVDRLRLLCEVADGLSYRKSVISYRKRKQLLTSASASPVHSRSIVHGDLTGSNILIKDDGKACLCDFGLSTIVAEVQGAAFFTSTIGGAVRWADALLYRLNSEEPVVSTWSDIYSFGSVMLEVLSGRIPYHYIRTDAQVVIELHKGVKPRRPAQSFVSDAQWAVIERCWGDDVLCRPKIGEVCAAVQALYQESVDLHLEGVLLNALV
ncbi:Serine/threonine-protein kinase STY46 [Hypsizygus marmoreus]|uniref:Serine/threonine-protein kinase STY46 n=1 Tax=Hypsizygus marmoreus TaxID=39966 RepID=A0A369J322_HYPMA|nr:Serine/threonine-protein kinase STY46 [Hypsizygus marmoreus]